MPPPNCYNELSRMKAVDSYKSARHWGEQSIFKKLIGNIRKEFKIKGVSISIVTHNKVLIKYESLLNMTEIARSTSIDGHAILSKDYFLLLDAKHDWRTANSPFVTSLPFVRFYCGVPLVTSKREPIGILSVFDSYALKEFELEKISKLKSFADEIMTILDASAEDLNLIYKNTNQNLNSSLKSINSNNSKLLELNELSLKLGRATSRGSSLTVFEKDGSGGPYTQNYNFRILSEMIKESKKQEVINNKQVRDKLIKCGSMKRGADSLSKIICSNYNIDFVYILEIRIAESFRIDPEYFGANENKIDADGFKHFSKLVKDNSKETDFMTRIIGSFGSGYSSLVFENLMHHKSFQAEFGIGCKDPAGNSLYNSGIIMPFYKHNSKLVRQKKIRPSAGNNQKSNNPVNVYLRSGGYLIGLFNRDINKEFDADLISKVFSNVSTLRKVFISG